MLTKKLLKRKVQLTITTDIDCSISEYGRELAFVKAGERQRINIDIGLHQLSICGLSYGEAFMSIYTGKTIGAVLLSKQEILYINESSKAKLRIESKSMSLSGLNAYLTQIGTGVKISIHGDNKNQSYQEIVIPSKCTIAQSLQNIEHACISEVVGSVYLHENIIGFSFKYAKGIKYVYLPDTIKTIPKQAFANSGIESIILPNSIEEIKQSAFEDCKSLKQIVFPSCLKKIGAYAFAGCKSLSDVIFSDTIVSIDKNAFEGCTNLKSVVAGSIDSWCSHDFADYWSNPIFISNKLSIRDEIISGDLTIPNTIAKIKKYAFCGLKSLNAVVIPGSVQCVETGAFEDCINIKKLCIEEGTSVLGQDAFRNLSELRRIELPRSIKSIKSGAFEGCKKLKQVYYSGDIKSWCEIEFDNNPIVYSHRLHISSKEIKGELKLSDVSRISPYAFSGCTGITGIVVTDRVSEIGKNAFENCSSITHLEIEDGCETVWKEAFANLSNLSNVILPGSLISIKEGAFKNCIALEKLHIPHNVKIIGDSAFEGCSKLSSVIIPKGVENLSSSVFSDCTKLESIKMPNNIKSIGSWAFAGCTSLTSIELPEGLTSIGSSIFSGCVSLQSVNLPSTLKTMGPSAFFNCESIESIVIPDRIKVVSDSCFSCCHRLNSVILGKRIEYIGQLAFDNTNIYKIVINGSMWPEFKYFGSGRGANYKEIDPFGFVFNERNYRFEQNIVQFNIYCDARIKSTMPQRNTSRR